MLEWSLEAFRAAASIDEIVVAAPPGQHERVADLGGVAGAGGEHRSESVAKALELTARRDRRRPRRRAACHAGLIDAVVEELAAEDGAAAVIAAAQVTDTIKQASDGGEVERTLDRSGLWAVQTPQAFRADALREALSDPDSYADATDDAMLVERRGGRPDPLLVRGQHQGHRPIDLRVAEVLLRERQARRT